MAGAWLDPFRLCLNACDERCEEYFVTADKTLLIDVSQLSAATCHTGLRGYLSTMLQMRMARRMKVGFASLIAAMVAMLPTSWPSPALALSDEDWDSCARAAEFSSDRPIRGCTAVIKAGRADHRSARRCLQQSGRRLQSWTALSKTMIRPYA